MFRRFVLPRLFLPLCLLGAILLGAAGKLWLINDSGSDLPYLDAWIAEGRDVLQPWVRGEPLTAALLKSHHGHRPALTRALGLAETALNGQWDNRLQCVVNAFLHGAALAFFVALVAPRLNRTGVWLVAVVAALLVALPFAAQNTLFGFDSFFYLLLLVGIPGVWFSLHHRAGTACWWVGLLACGLALFTLASGLLAPAAVALVSTWRGLRLPRRRLDSAITAAAAAALVAGGLWMYQPVHDDTVLHAAGLGQFAVAFAYQLSFPLFEAPWLFLLLQWPALWWIASSLLDPDRKESIAPLAGLLVFQTLQAAMLAYTRGGNDHATSPYYGDIQGLSMLLNAAALGWLWNRTRVARSSRIALTTAWALTAAIGLQLRCDSAFAGFLVHWRTTREAESVRLRQFVMSGNASLILEAPPQEIALPPAERSQLLELLEDSGLRALLPASVRAPVRLLPSKTTTEQVVAEFGDSLPDPQLPGWTLAQRGPGDGPALFVSQPLWRGLLPVLRFRVAGDIGTAAFPFSLHSMASGETVALRLEERTGERWRTVNLEVPEHPVVLVVGPSAAGSWGAFTAPVELGYGSWIAGKIAKNWLAFALAGSACLAGALALRSQSDIQRRDTFSLDDDGFVRLSSRSK